jgi:predicted nucleotidyltransferase
MNRQEILETVQRYRTGKGRQYPIVRPGIFGSAARDHMRDGSDVDIVVELGKPDILMLIGIKQDLEEALHCPVDIVRYRTEMNPELKQRIEAEAVYVWSATDA